MMIEDTRSADRALRERAVCHLLQRVATYPVTTKSDDARLFADEIAEAASRCFISTAVIPTARAGYYGRIWKITLAGLAFLEVNVNLIASEEVNYVESFVHG